MLDIVNNGGAVITEFPPGAKPLPWHFPCRNRIISGLCQGILVIEAAERSGALITADCALEQGREVFALPGNVTSNKSAGTNKLIKQGAHLVTCSPEILEVLGLGELAVTLTPKGIDSLGLNKTELAIWSILSYDPIDMDQIIKRVGLLPQEVAANVTLLEIKGLVRILPGKLYVRSSI
ncbi:hypothetical protein N752_02735 [Desulforamulus aquiferis]|nr:DNA-processing protein DprA [Desulforamulus aquiferis]RYD06602.1 hypothetical protein N752_02735 [Desulforamulus aquiferis]